MTTAFGNETSILDDLIDRLDRDVLRAAAGLSPEEMRFLVDSYYQLQKLRIQLGNAARAGADDAEPVEFPAWLHRQFALLETRLQSVMRAWASDRDAGRWALAVYGIGPVLAAGFLAHIDPARSETAGGLWRFAGLDPTLAWDRGQKRPYNARLKVLAWKAGDSFVKFHNRKECYYGLIYAERKALEIARNEAGAFADQAAVTLAEKRITDPDTLAHYRAGKLPPGRIDLRARRYAVKLFLAHLHEVMREAAGLPVPAPYPIAVLGHAHRIPPPNWPPVDRDGDHPP